eukprot:11818638-Prorocentrum_lima.AAC.1
MSEWLAQLKEAVGAGLDKQTACQLLGWVGSSLAVHTVRTTLQDQSKLDSYDSVLQAGWEWLAGANFTGNQWLLATLPKKMGGAWSQHAGAFARSGSYLGVAVGQETGYYAQWHSCA